MSDHLPRARPGRFAPALLLAALLATAARGEVSYPHEAGPRDIAACRALVQEYRAMEAEPADAESCGFDPTTLGIDDLCPLQTEALLAHPWAPLLARQRAELMLEDLEGLYALHAEYGARQPGASPGIDSLPAVLAALDAPAEQPPSIWQRLWNWLKGLWGEREAPDVEWIKAISIPDVVAKVVLYGAVLLLVLMAVGIVVTELRATPRRRRQQPGGWQDGGPQGVADLTLDAIGAAPLGEQPGLLLRLVLNRLRTAGVLRVAASSTHRDIALAAGTLHDGGCRDALGSLSSAAERAAYGGWQPQATDMERLHRAYQRVISAARRTRSASRKDADE